ncbi:MAG: nitroreductase/quinone reductase family protein [Actinoplanes sp.]
MSRYSALLRRLGSQRWFASAGRLLTPLDRRIYRWTRGRWSVIGRDQLPSLLITTTGRRSGLPRTQPLLYATDGADYVVIGSNWGQANHPAWTANLLASPEARVTLGGREFGVRATLATGAERERLWPLFLSIWPGYAAYAKRATSREIRIFRLTPSP